MLPLLVYLKSVHKVNEWLGKAYIYIHKYILIWLYAKPDWYTKS